ncbi:MAG: RNA 3'-terminal phosphate cyclase [Smithella sp.]
MIEIDGNYGEGGGQILRTALSLSCLHQIPFRISNIRRRREKPGLMPQHLTAVRAAQMISDAAVVGDFKGSTDLSFSPNGLQGGDIFYNIGTAGSTSLVFQTLIPALAFGCNQKSTVTLKGGTHVPFSPSFQYLNEIFSPMLSMLGINVKLKIINYGFYPRGGGEVRLEIHPVKKVKPLKLLERGMVTELTGISGVGNLPLSIAERQKNAALAHIAGRIKPFTHPIRIDVRNVPGPAQGTFIFLKIQSEHSSAGFTALGARGKPAEKVGEEAAMDLVGFYTCGAPVDRHLADQIVLYLSLCEEESEFVVSGISQHLLTNLWVISRFHNFKYSIDGEAGHVGRVKIKKR